MSSLSGSLEELVLVALCHNTDLAANIALRVTPELFTTRHFRVIAKAALDHVARYAEAPQNHIADILESELNKGETGTILWKQIGRMEELKNDLQPEYVKTELDRFIAIHRMRLSLGQAMDHLHKGDLDKAQEAIHEVHYDAGVTPGIWMNEPTQALSFLDEKDDEDEFRLGIEALDSRGIRPKRKTEFVVMGPKKRGKSTCLINIGTENAIFGRKNVLHITLEMSAELVAKKYIQSFTGWTASETAEKVLRVPVFKRDELNNYIGVEFDVLKPEVISRANRKEVVERLHRATRGARRLLVKEYPTGGLTISQLKMFLEYLKKAEKFEPDMIILDYANLMNINSNQLRIETGRIFRDLRGIAVERNLAMVTATQGNRSSEHAKIVGSTHVAEDWSVMGTADIVISICRTPEEKEKRLARLYVAAAREVADQYMVQISQAYEICQFARDSVYMNKVAVRDFERMMEGDDDE